MSSEHVHVHVVTYLYTYRGLMSDAVSDTLCNFVRQQNVPIRHVPGRNLHVGSKKFNEYTGNAIEHLKGTSTCTCMCIYCTYTLNVSYLLLSLIMC